MTNTSDLFIQAGTTALQFLETDYGFEVAEIVSPPDVRSSLEFYKLAYRNNRSRGDSLFVCLATSPVRLELDLDLGRGWPPQHQDTISVYELLAIEYPNSALDIKWGVYSAFGDVHKMTDQYVSLGNALARHGQRFFSNDPSLWSDLHRFRKAQATRFQNEETSRDADLAYKQRDWPRTVVLLERLGDSRTKLQSARLAYARKQNAR